MELQGVDGSLLTGLQVEKLRYSLDGGGYSAEQVVLDYSLLALRDKRVVLDRISADRIVIVPPFNV